MSTGSLLHKELYTSADGHEYQRHHVILRTCLSWLQGLYNKDYLTRELLLKKNVRINAVDEAWILSGAFTVEDFMSEDEDEPAAGWGNKDGEPAEPEEQRLYGEGRRCSRIVVTSAIQLLEGSVLPQQ